MLLGEEGRRRLGLRNMGNNDLFGCYDFELVRHNDSKKELYKALRLWHHASVP
jgi:hypothetical protein